MAAFPITFPGTEPKLDRARPHLFPAELANTAGVLQGGAGDPERLAFMKHLVLKGASVDEYMQKHVTTVRTNPGDRHIRHIEAAMSDPARHISFNAATWEQLADGMVRYSRGKSDAVKASRELRATHQGSKSIVEHNQIFG